MDEDQFNDFQQASPDHSPIKIISPSEIENPSQIHQINAQSNTSYQVGFDQNQQVGFQEEVPIVHAITQIKGKQGNQGQESIENIQEITKQQEGNIISMIEKTSSPEQTIKNEENQESIAENTINTETNEIKIQIELQQVEQNVKKQADPMFQDFINVQSNNHQNIHQNNNENSPNKNENSLSNQQEENNHTEQANEVKQINQKSQEKTEEEDQFGEFEEETKVEPSQIIQKETISSEKNRFIASSQEKREVSWNEDPYQKQFDNSNKVQFTEKSYILKQNSKDQHLQELQRFVDGLPDYSYLFKLGFIQ